MLQTSNYDLAITPSLPGLGTQAPHWFAAYTCARHEKSVAGQLSERNIESFVPLYQSVHRWKDRFKRVELPLFPGYVFVRIDPADRLRVLKIAGVVRFVSFNGSPAALDFAEIETLRGGLLQGVATEPHPYLTVGRRVRVIRGPLVGVEGIVVRKKDQFRVVISINLIMRSISAEVEAGDLEWLPRGN